MSATYTVDTTADTVVAGAGVLSLREALAWRTPIRDADTITFDGSVRAGIVLAGSQLTVGSDVTIDGGGASPSMRTKRAACCWCRATATHAMSCCST